MQLSRNPATGKEFAKYSQPVVAHRNLVVGILRSTHLPNPPLEGPLGVRIVANFPRPKNHTGTGRNSSLLKDWAPKYVTVPADIDKISRLVLDAGTIAGVWRDDAQVAVLLAQKVYIDPPTTPSTEIVVWSLS